jgi:nucleotide-binding universal stress UspA family protein
MSTHGHRFLADVLHGTTADRVRHLVTVPVLLVRDNSQRTTNN